MDTANFVPRDVELHGKPDRRITIRTLKGGSIRRDGRISFSRMADLVPFIVRSESEQAKKERAAKRCLPTLETLQKNGNYRTDAEKLRMARIVMAMRDLSRPMFGVVLEGQRYYVSASVLADWRRERIKPELFSMPVIQRHGMRGLRTREVHDDILRQQSDWRRNEHAIGMAQEAWRMARLEGDNYALKAARHWLYHGNLKPCKDRLCKDCGTSRRLQARELTTLAFLYIAEYGEDRKGRKVPKRQHRMPWSPPDGFLTEPKDVDRKHYERALASGQLLPTS